MRKISPAQILVFVCLCAVALTVGIGGTLATVGRLPLGGYQPIAVVVCAFVSVWASALGLLRLSLVVAPIEVGEIAMGSREEFGYHVYVLFQLIFFHPVQRSGLLPAPFLRAFLIGCGCKMGENTFPAGILTDPIMVTLGKNAIVGLNSVLIGHVMEGTRLAHYPIIVGDGATIGSGATILPDVVVGDDAIVATGAVVKKGTRIGKNEIWGGVPAKLIGMRDGTVAPVRVREQVNVAAEVEHRAASHNRLAV